MENNDALLCEWSLTRFTSGITHFEDVFEKVKKQVKDLNEHSSLIRVFLEDLRNSFTEQDKGLKTLTTAFKENIKLTMEDANFEKNFEGIYTFVDRKIQASQTKGAEIEGVISKITISQMYTDKSMKKNIDDMSRHLQHLQGMFKKYRKEYIVYLRICKAARMDYSDQIKKHAVISKKLMKISKQLENVKDTKSRKALLKSWSVYKQDLGQEEVEKMQTYFRRGERKLTKNPKKRSKVEVELNERWLEMVVKVNSNLKAKTETIEAKKEDDFSNFKVLVEEQTRKIRERFKEMSKVFDKYFEQVDQVLRRCLEIERNWKTEIVKSVTDVYGRKRSEDFQMKFAFILKVRSHRRK
jgi:hypothetical protein